MSVESSTGSDATGTRSRRARFREWRRRRPFAGGLLLMLAGLLIAYVPMQFAFELLLVGGAYTYIGLAWAIGVFLTGAFVLYRPEFSTIFGVLGVVLSILSLLGALGGLLIGMIVGIIGGNLCVAWSRPDAATDSGGGPGDDRRPVRTDGGSPRSGDDPDDAGEPARVADPHTPVAGAVPLSRLSILRLRTFRAALGGSPGGNYLERLRRLLRRSRRDSGESLRRAKSPAAPGRLLDAATAGGSRRLAVTVAVLVVTSGTLTLVSAVPAAAFLGDQEESSYTVDVGEIRLGEGGQICAAEVGDDTYRVTITDATLVDTTIYQQQGDGTVKTDFPTLQVRDTMVLYTTGDDENVQLLAETAGCTEEDQTSRTVFRTHEGASERLHSPEGVTMLNLEATGATVPKPGGFQFAAPGNDSEASPVPEASDVTSVADGIDDVVDESFVDRLENRTDEVDPVGGTAQDVNGTLENATARPDPDDAVENATGEVTNVTGNVADTATETVGEVENTTEPVDETVENTTDRVNETVDDPTGTVNETVEDPTDAVDDTTGDATDAVNDTTGDATDAVNDTTGDATDTVDDTTDTVDDTTDTVDDTTDTVDDAAGGTGDVSNTTDDATDAVNDTTSTVDDTTGDTTDGTTSTVDDTTGETTDSVDDTVETVEGSAETVDDTVETAADTDGGTATSTESEETVTSTESEETVTSTETVTTATATPDGSDALPDWLEQVDDESAVLATIEVTPGGVDDVENVTTETQYLDDATIDADDNLTRLDNGTVLLLNGTDPGEIDWPDGDVDGTDDTVDDTVETVEETETVDDSDDSVDEATVESDDGTDTTLALAGV